MNNKYTFIKNLTPSYTSMRNRVGLYRDDRGRRLIVKQCDTKSNLKAVRFLSNEAKILKSLSSLRELKKVVPEFVTWIVQKNKVLLVVKEVPGITIDKIRKSERKNIIVDVYKKLHNVNISSKIQIRHPVFFIFGVVLNTAQVIRKDVRNTLFYLRMMSTFIFTYTPTLIFGISYSLSHRDLWPDNIIFSKKDSSFTILDWESAVITDSLYDLAQITMIYSKDFNNQELILFLKNNLENSSEKKRFVSLAIYNALHTLSVTSLHDSVFAQTKEFLQSIQTTISPNLLHKKSLFEVINGFTLILIWFFYSLMKLDIVDKKSKIILCYHSISNDGWQFSTRVKEFKSHIQVLKRFYDVQNLTTLLKSTKGGVHISFDDGYKNLISNALPILKEQKVTATLFTLGKPEHANRFELDNNLPLLNIREVKILRNNGWEIGFHTNTHPYLASLSPIELESEIVNGKKDLEDKLNMKIDYFAYPKGLHSNIIQKYVKKAGFKTAFTVDGKSASVSDNVLLIDRVPISGELSDKQLLAMISPLGLKVSQIFLMILQIKDRIENSFGNHRKISALVVEQATI